MHEFICHINTVKLMQCFSITLMLTKIKQLNVFMTRANEQKNYSIIMKKIETLNRKMKKKSRTAN